MNVDLQDADLNSAAMYRVDLSGANLSRAVLLDADLAGASFRGADLSHAHLLLLGHKMLRPLKIARLRGYVG
jgi:uncharacterized protein YjbI with pentapeptide repeats